MEQLQIQHIVEEIANCLFRSHDLAPLTLVCRKWYEYINPIHKKQHHTFRYQRDIIAKAVNAGFERFHVYKMIPTRQGITDIQYASASRIYTPKLIWGQDTYVYTARKSYFIKCIRTIRNESSCPPCPPCQTNYRDQQSIASYVFYPDTMHIDYLNLTPDSKFLTRSAGEVYKPIEPQNTSRRNMIRKYIKKYKTPPKHLKELTI